MPLRDMKENNQGGRTALSPQGARDTSDAQSPFGNHAEWRQMSQIKKNYELDKWKASELSVDPGQNSKADNHMNG